MNESRKKEEIKFLKESLYEAIRSSLERVLGKVVASYVLAEARASGFNPFDPINTINKLLATIRSLFGEGSVALEDTIAEEFKARARSWVREENLQDVLKRLRRHRS